MLRLLLIIGLVAMWAIAASAQQPTVLPCPTISVEGKFARMNPSESIEFVATAEANGWPGPFEYHWAASWSDPVTRERVTAHIEGQGTSSIRILKPGNGITATVTGIGFPAGCENTASETAGWTPAPEGWLIAEISQTLPELGADIAAKIVGEINKNPGSQLFVFSVYGRNIPSAVISGHQRQILWGLRAKGLEGNRITFHTVQPGRDLDQFWLVPPGALPPKCSECVIPGERAKVLECPLITVSGPAGITKPGDPMTFTAYTSALPPNVKKMWEVTGGEILRGQNIDQIKVAWKPNYTVTATLNVTGLPEGCPSTFSESAAVTIHWAPRLLYRSEGSSNKVSSAPFQTIARQAN